MPYTYQYPHPAVTVDCVIFSTVNCSLQVLLIQRIQEPFAGFWALPGGFVDIDESLQDAAARELREETGLSLVGSSLVGVYGEVDRDPRERVISVAFLSLIDQSLISPRSGSDAGAAVWMPVSSRQPLAFDHRRIVKDALRKLQDDARRFPVIASAIREPFTLQELRNVYEAIYGQQISPRKFSAQLMSTGWLKPVHQTSHARKQPRQYRFDRQAIRTKRKLPVGLKWP